MRIAALAFGILAGLVASLILALGGLDAAALTADPRQISLVRFGLFVVAYFGVLGAGVALAAPLVGAILLAVGAVAWIIAALVLHHGPDYVMLTSPGLLLIAAVFAVLAFRVQRQGAFAGEAREPSYADEDPLRSADEEDSRDRDEETGAVTVGATFFGDHGTATPMRGVMGRSPDPSGRSYDRADASRDSWEPIRRRTEPPRQKPMFRNPEEEYDEEGGFSRAARLTSSVLSFGLYAGLAAAAALVFVNLRAADTGRPTATVTNFEASVTQPSSSISSVAPKLAEAPVLPPPPSSSPAAAPILSPSAAEPATATLTPPSLPATPGVTVAEATTPLAAPADEPASSAPEPSASADASGAAPAEPAPEDLTLGESQAAAELMPYPMPPGIAAGRFRPASQRPAPPPQPRADTGL
ncbi:MAG TPA: hypothetical protein VHA07_07315 [Devosia sp.]|nr:hypothetical protein [Devosia sp.]